LTRQNREKFIVDRKAFMEYSDRFRDISWSLGSAEVQFAALEASGLEVINKGRVSKLEAYLSLICFRHHAKNRIKAVTRAEEEFSASKLLPSEHVHPALWRKAEEVKRGK
jgi:hypothetical protein